MALGRNRSRSPWAVTVEAERRRWELEVMMAIGRRPLIEADDETNEVRVSVPNVHPSEIDAIADALAPLWPGFLAPLAVELVLLDADRWDGEAMALRCAALDLPNDAA